MADSNASEPKVFLNGKPVENPHEDHHHVSPIWEFTAVFVTLLFLTLLPALVRGPRALEPARRDDHRDHEGLAGRALLHAPLL